LSNADVPGSVEKHMAAPVHWRLGSAKGRDTISGSGSIGIETNPTWQAQTHRQDQKETR
jgi:hypothetical protein